MSQLKAKGPERRNSKLLTLTGISGGPRTSRENEEYLKQKQQAYFMPQKDFKDPVHKMIVLKSYGLLPSMEQIKEKNKSRIKKLHSLRETRYTQLMKNNRDIAKVNKKRLLNMSELFTMTKKIHDDMSTAIKSKRPKANINGRRAPSVPFYKPWNGKMNTEPAQYSARRSQERSERKMHCSL